MKSFSQPGFLGAESSSWTMSPAVTVSGPIKDKIAAYIQIIKKILLKSMRFWNYHCSRIIQYKIVWTIVSTEDELKYRKRLWQKGIWRKRNCYDLPKIKRKTYGSSTSSWEDWGNSDSSSKIAFATVSRVCGQFSLTGKQYPVFGRGHTTSPRYYDVVYTK